MSSQILFMLFVGSAISQPAVYECGNNESGKLWSVDGDGSSVLNVFSSSTDDCMVSCRQTLGDCQAWHTFEGSCTHFKLIPSGTIPCAGQEYCAIGTCSCGDFSIDLGEQCDITTLNDQSCVSRGFAAGDLSCDSYCQFDTSQCKNAVCGNNNIESGEQCDTNNLNLQSCATRGFTAGKLSCGSKCQFDTTQCTSAPVCGNNIIESGEQCDKDSFNGRTCKTYGMIGTLLCDPSTCYFDDSQCTYCGNGIINQGEPCDTNNLLSESCQSKGFEAGELLCTKCQFDTTQCRIPIPKCPDTLAGHFDIINGKIGGPIRGGSTQDCRTSCLATPGCRVWTKSVDNDECILGESGGSFIPEAASHVSGHCGLPTPRCSILGQGYWKDANLIYKYNGGSTDDCRDSCGLTPGCRVWTKDIFINDECLLYRSGTFVQDPYLTSGPCTGLCS